jgi:hypothetical protein
MGYFNLGNLQTNQKVMHEITDQKSVVFAKGSAQHTQKTLDFKRPNPVYEKYIISCFNPSDDTVLRVKVFNKKETHIYGLAQAGAAGTITLNSTSDANDDFYNNATITIVSGTGKGQVRTISDYTGATKVANITPNWTTNPSTDSYYEIAFTHYSYVTVVTFAAKATVTGTVIEKYESSVLTGLFNGDSDVRLVISNDTAVPNNDADAFEAVFEIIGN